jgi:translation elongation factor EF-Tu-like GTPase
MGFDGPQLWMTIQDVFQIKGRGTVVTGHLQGNGLLSVGDTMVCNGESWQVSGIEQFRAVLTTAAPGANIGVLLRHGPADHRLRGWTVHFEPQGSAGPYVPSEFSPPKKKRWRN